MARSGSRHRNAAEAMAEVAVDPADVETLTLPAPQPRRSSVLWTSRPQRCVLSMPEVFEAVSNSANSAHSRPNSRK